MPKLRQHAQKLVFLVPLAAQWAADGHRLGIGAGGALGQDATINKALEFTDGRKPEKLMYSKKYMKNRL